MEEIIIRKATLNDIEILRRFEQGVISAERPFDPTLKKGDIFYYDLEGTANLLQSVCDVLYKKNINSVMVEGGARLLQSFIDDGLWDEARIITNKNLLLHDGVAAPVLNAGTIIKRETYLDDEVVVIGRSS